MADINGASQLSLNAENDTREDCSIDSSCRKSNTAHKEFQNYKKCLSPEDVIRLEQNMRNLCLHHPILPTFNK